MVPDNLNWQPVESSNLRHVAFEYTQEDGKIGNLYVRFKSNSVYLYRGVPVEEYVGLLASESKGKYLHAHIKNRYSYTKLN